MSRVGGWVGGVFVWQVEVLCIYCEMLVLVSVSDMAPLVWIFQCTVFSSVSVILYTPLFPLQYQHIYLWEFSHIPFSSIISDYCLSESSLGRAALGYIAYHHCIVGSTLHGKEEGLKMMMCHFSHKLGTERQVHSSSCLQRD